MKYKICHLKSEENLLDYYMKILDEKGIKDFPNDIKMHERRLMATKNGVEIYVERDGFGIWHLVLEKYNARARECEITHLPHFEHRIQGT